MSKRYVIQVLSHSIFADGVGQSWVTVQHPSGDWMTRSRSTAIADAAKMIQNGETRELRIVLSEPVYSLTPIVDSDAIKIAAETLYNDFAAAVDGDDDDLTETLEAQVGQVPDTSNTN